MKIGLKASGIGRVVQQFRSIGQKVPEGARGVMRRAAERIVVNAKEYVPEDVGNLKDAITILRDYGTRGRLEIDIDIIPTGRETTRPKNTKITHGSLGTKGAGVYHVDVLQYALLVHENYETHVAYRNGPSEKTKEKMARNPGKVGSGFLRRAAEEERARLEPQMIATIEEIIERERD